jgi:hypothetical protein
LAKANKTKRIISLFRKRKEPNQTKLEMNTIPSIFTVLASVLVACASAVAQVPDAVVQSLSAPDRVETRVGPLEFKDGLPTGATSNAVRDTVTFDHALEPFFAKTWQLSEIEMVK